MKIAVIGTGYRGRIMMWQRRIDPLPDGAVPVILQDEEEERFAGCEGKRYVISDGVAVYDETLPEYRGYHALQNLMSELRAEMATQDYKQLKYLRGELTEEEWTEVKAWYAGKTAEYNVLEAEMEIVQNETITIPGAES